MKIRTIHDFENNERINNLANPTLLQSPATKYYVDYEPYIIVSINTTLTLNNKFIEVNSPNLIVTLPTAIGINGKIFRILNTSTGNLKINTSLSQTIGNKATGNLTYFDLRSEEWLDLISNNLNWRII